MTRAVFGASSSSGSPWFSCCEREKLTPADFGAFSESGSSRPSKPVREKLTPSALGAFSDSEAFTSAGLFNFRT